MSVCGTFCCTSILLVPKSEIFTSYMELAHKYGYKYRKCARIRYIRDWSTYAKLAGLKVDEDVGGLHVAVDDVVRVKVVQASRRAEEEKDRFFFALPRWKLSRGQSQHKNCSTENNSNIARAVQTPLTATQKMYLKIVDEMVARGLHPLHQNVQRVVVLECVAEGDDVLVVEIPMQLQLADLR